MMNADEQDDWDYLLSQWGEAYAFSHNPGQVTAYSARRRDDGKTLKARSAKSLGNLIRTDYGRRPVPRGHTATADPARRELSGPGQPA